MECLSSRRLLAERDSCDKGVKTISRTNKNVQTKQKEQKIQQSKTVRISRGKQNGQISSTLKESAWQRLLSKEDQRVLSGIQCNSKATGDFWLERALILTEGKITKNNSTEAENNGRKKTISKVENKQKSTIS